MNNNILKNIIFVPILSVILVNFNLRAEESKEDLTEMLEQNLTELEELETTMQNDGVNTHQNDSQYFRDLDKAILLQDDDKKEIRASKTQEIGENADLIFNIREQAKNSFNTIVIKNREGKTEGSNQNGMKDSFNKIKIQGQPLSSTQNKGYREALYLSLDWDKNLLNKFKDKLKHTIEIGTKLLQTQMVILGINIQITSQNTLKIVCCDDKAKTNLYNKLTTKELKKIQTKVNETMTLRKQWQKLINQDEFVFHNDLLKKVQEIYSTIKDINKEIRKILE